MLRFWYLYMLKLKALLLSIASPDDHMMYVFPWRRFGWESKCHGVGGGLAGMIK